MTKYSLDLTTKQELRFLSDLVADLRAEIPRIDILLVGAMARDLLLFYAHGMTLVPALRDSVTVGLIRRSPWRALRKRRFRKHMILPNSLPMTVSTGYVPSAHIQAHLTDAARHGLPQRVPP